MSLADFQAVVAALDARDIGPPPPAPPIETVAVLGGCHIAQTMAVAFHAGGATVRLWSPLGDQMRALRAAGSISVRGEDLVGNYAADPDSNTRIELADGLFDAASSADAIIVAGQPSEQRAIATLLAQGVAPGAAYVVVPGFTFGALELRWWLRSMGEEARGPIVELADVPWSATATGPNTVVLGSPRAVRLAAMPSVATGPMLGALSPYLPNLEPAPTVIHTSMADSAGLLQIPPLLFDGGALRPEPDALLPGSASGRG